MVALTCIMTVTSSCQEPSPYASEVSATRLQSVIRVVYVNNVPSGHSLEPLLDRYIYLSLIPIPLLCPCQDLLLQQGEDGSQVSCPKALVPLFDICGGNASMLDYSMCAARLSSLLKHLVDMVLITPIQQYHRLIHWRPGLALCNHCMSG